MAQVFMPPTVQLFDYRATDAATGAVLTEGCGAGNLLVDELAYCGSINVRAPLETEYYVEIRSKRYVEGTLSATQGKDYFCQRQDTKPRLSHMNPSCYRSMDPMYHELLGVSLLDGNGNEYPPNGYANIEQQPGDVERFHVKSHEYLSVHLGLQGVCGTLSDYTCLNSFQTP